MSKTALNMLKCSISNTIITFREKYYQYGIEDDPMMRALSIRGYNSAWYANLVGCYILDMTEDDWVSLTLSVKFFRNNEHAIFPGTKLLEDLQTWLNNFQNLVNIIIDSIIQFTMDIWKQGKESRIKEPKRITVVKTFSFTYLDAEMSFNESKAISFGAYSKPGFNTKYLNCGNHHPEHCTKAVPKALQCV